MAAFAAFLPGPPKPEGTITLRPDPTDPTDHADGQMWLLFRWHSDADPTSTEEGSLHGGLPPP